MLKILAPDVKRWLIWKDPDARKDYRWEEEGMTKDKMVGWHHWLDGHEFEQAPGEIVKLREAWYAAVHGVAKNWTWHALEKEMATHSSVLAWRIPGMAEPGGLPSMGSHRVGHNWSDLAVAAAEQLNNNKIYRAKMIPKNNTETINCFNTCWFILWRK